MRKKIHFIYNPISGNKKSKLTLARIQSVFPSTEYDVELKKTAFKYHAKSLTIESIDEGAECIVACGGDGTINEVAANLVNTSIPLGIIPRGSGNGLSGNLSIPKKMDHALVLIKRMNQKKVDVGCINDTHYFFSNIGFGFDVSVIKHYEKMLGRGFLTYFKAILKSLYSWKYIDITFSEEDSEEHITISPFIFLISNSNELGYKLSLTPKASLMDGLLDFLYVKKMHFIKLIPFFFLFFFKKHHQLKTVTYKQIKKLKIKTSSKKTKIQVDGEYKKLDTSLFTIRVLEKKLIVICE